MICEVFLCQDPATYRVAVQECPGFTWPYILCTGHATGKKPLKGTILAIQEIL